MKAITLDHGVRVLKYDLPPNNFDPFTAKPEDLARFGLPSIPQNPEILELYRGIFNRLKGRLHFIEPEFQVNGDRSTGPLSRVSVSAKTSTNWSGVVVYPPSNQAFQWVYGQWVIPNVYLPSNYQAGVWYRCASWIGIDGDSGSKDVFQAGVVHKIMQNSSSGELEREVHAWAEWFPASAVTITNFPVSPGDLITVTLCSSDGEGSTTGNALLSNYNSGAMTIVGLTAPSDKSLVGNCAEWIVEAPTITIAGGDTVSSMPNYGEVIFTVGQAGTSRLADPYVSAGSGEVCQIIETVGSNQELVSTAQILNEFAVKCLYE
ncbi:MAG TPA: G1 family glutamic endopeptidase [Candidatus Angelobacter sp.]|nr:G1 family glutamic endopeptidase [Candidatus Angelobacter sp.]